MQLDQIQHSTMTKFTTNDIIKNLIMSTVCKAMLLKARLRGNYIYLDWDCGSGSHSNKSNIADRCSLQADVKQVPPAADLERH